jgi:hypothetical protein
MKERENGFYKLDGEELLYAPESVGGKDWAIRIRDHARYKYPVNGWYYFETRAEAKGFFNWEDPPEGIPDHESIPQQRERLQRIISEWAESLESKPTEKELQKLMEMTSRPVQEKSDQDLVRNKSDVSLKS